MFGVDIEIDEFALWRNSAPEIFVSGTVEILYWSVDDWHVAGARVNLTNEDGEESSELLAKEDFLCMLLEAALRKFNLETVEEAIRENIEDQIERMKQEAAE
jgi:hypothetical protein